MNIKDTYIEINRIIEGIKYQSYEDRMIACSLLVTLLNCMGNQADKVIPNYGEYRKDVLNNIEAICDKGFYLN